MKPYETHKLLRHSQYGRQQGQYLDKADLNSEGSGTIRNKASKRAWRRIYKRADKARSARIWQKEF